MSPESTDPTLNNEAIPAQQPIAASPLPTFERKPRSGWRSGWTFLLLLLTAVVLVGAFYRYGGL